MSVAPVYEEIRAETNPSKVSENKNTGRSLISFSFLSILCAAFRLIDSIRTDTSTPPARKQSQFQHALYFVLHDASAVAPHHILQDHTHESSIAISFFFKLMYRNLFVNRPLAHFLTCSLTPPLLPPQTSSHPQSSLYKYRRAFWT